MENEPKRSIYKFEISLIGHGETPEEAWAEICSDIWDCMDYQKEDLVEVRNEETEEIEWSKAKKINEEG